MKDRFFIDTNIFIYSIGEEDDEKYYLSKELIKKALRSEKGLISFQVVQEFINSSKKKFNFSDQSVKDFGLSILFPLWNIYPSRDLYLKAIEIQERYKYSFYDSLIIAAALEGNCKTLYSEDLQNGQKIEGLTIVDPFKS